MKPFHEKLILDRIGIARSLSRIAHEIIEKNKGTNDLILIGIRTCGVHLANRLKKKVAEIEKVELPTGVLDITLYRDDLMTKKDRPILKTTDIPYDITKKRVVLIDDVLFTGRTIRAALDGLMDLGRPETIQLAVLIDRGHRELPIRADFVGKNLPTGKDEKVKVLLEEEGEEDRVVILHSRREDSTVC
ncbi:MAG: bifunctional pyr operon transcriptional regulator/uracil phosphoribosyltransferase PyrR [Nitrospirae bacterium]|nr:bifunctional pyr operon transcriptional regulator/uracil phosphoribosyltransferase PyrR [Nitrospirota bacterium]MBI3593519.1 bifunctional pyr operon transcriptional regulator/uracil phosphoribosyltransferase PyrR [Nitrospirota bacterium]